MDNKEKYLHWLSIAEYDLETAKAMFDSNRYLYVAFMCQQAIEKLSKGIYVHTFDKEAKYTHNINLVLTDIESITSQKEYEEYSTLFSDLTSFYIVGRYDAYKQDLSKKLTCEYSKILLNKAKEAFLWLKSQVKL